MFVLTVSSESVAIAMILVLIQVIRRFCECTLLSVYSDAKMSIVHYFVGFSFYFGVGLSVLAEAPVFSGRGKLLQWWPVTSFCVFLSTGVSDFSFTNFFSWNHILGSALFISASYIQFKSHSILANLRKDNNGIY